MAELEEVILYAFQQCVYYVSKVRLRSAPLLGAWPGSRPLAPPHCHPPSRLRLNAQGVCGPPKLMPPAPFTGACTETPEAQAALVGAPGNTPALPLRPAPLALPTLVFSPQSLYVCLPALLECPPFPTEPRESWCQAPQLPEELRRVVSIYQAALDLLRQAQVHPEIVSQVLAYLFFFSSTLLFNQLLDKGEAGRGCAPARNVSSLERQAEPSGGVLTPGSVRMRCDAQGFCRESPWRGGPHSVSCRGRCSVSVCMGPLRPFWFCVSPATQPLGNRREQAERSEVASTPPPCPQSPHCRHSAIALPEAQGQAPALGVTVVGFPGSAGSGQGLGGSMGLDVDWTASLQ